MSQEISITIVPPSPNRAVIHRLHLDGTTSVKTIWTESGTKPFLRWVGSKRQLLSELLARCPQKFGRYYEPFLGGGALFFALRPERATLSDINERLVATYKGVRNDVENVIGLLGGMEADHRARGRASYDEVRRVDPDIYANVGAAAWFIFLNKAGFNGLYRVNKKGKFNVPWGKDATKTICDAAALRGASRALAGATLRVSSFADTMDQAQEGDLVYLDPPYVPVAKGSFTAYDKTGFSEQDQKDLRDEMLNLKDRGVHVMLSNSIAARELYADPAFKVEVVTARRNVNSRGTGRGPVEEIIVT